MIFIPENDKEYFDWLDANPDGYVINSDKRGTSKSYPMLHGAQRSHINDRNTPNYTTAEYRKLCSTDKGSLEDWARREDGREMRFCSDCRYRRLI